jgi:hypothetical protein
MIYAYVAIQLALLTLALAGYVQVRKFLSSHTSISDHADLNSFRSLVRTNMYISLVYIVLGIPAILMSVYLGFAYGLIGMFAVLALNAPQFLFGKYLRSLEERARQLRCSSDLSDEFRLIGETWFKSALPNF